MGRSRFQELRELTLIALLIAPSKGYSDEGQLYRQRGKVWKLSNGAQLPEGKVFRMDLSSTFPFKESSNNCQPRSHRTNDPGKGRSQVAKTAHF